MAGPLTCWQSVCWSPSTGFLNLGLCTCVCTPHARPWPEGSPQLTSTDSCRRGARGTGRAWRRLVTGVTLGRGCVYSRAWEGSQPHASVGGGSPGRGVWGACPGAAASVPGTPAPHNSGFHRDAGRPWPPAPPESPCRPHTPAGSAVLERGQKCPPRGSPLPEECGEPFPGHTASSPAPYPVIVMSRPLHDPHIPGFTPSPQTPRFCPAAWRLPHQGQRCYKTAAREGPGPIPPGGRALRPGLRPASSLPSQPPPSDLAWCLLHP